MAGVELRNVTIKYRDGSVALRNFGLNISDGEFVVLTGPPGSGKTSVLRAIAGKERHTEGEILINGEPIDKKQTVAFVSRNITKSPNNSMYSKKESMHRSDTARKNIEEEARQRERNAAKMIGIEHLLERPANELSSAQRRKLAICRMAALDPEIYLLDDLLADLEAKQREHLMVEIIELHKMLESTFLYATRDQAEAMTLGARVVVMRDGVAQQTDTPTDIYQYPANLFVAAYFGAPQMNFLEARLANDGKSVVADWAISSSIRLEGVLASAVTDNDFMNREVILGIRPEDLKLCTQSTETSRDGHINAQVKHTAMLGSHSILYVSVSGRPLTLRDSSHTQLRAGDNIRLALSVDKIHLFDTNTERSIYSY